MHVDRLTSNNFLKHNVFQIENLLLNVFVCVSLGSTTNTFVMLHTHRLKSQSSHFVSI